MAETGRYMYAISRRIDPAALETVDGLDGGQLEIVAHRDLAAVVSEVSLKQYDEEALKQNLESLEWLERVARGHDAVVHAVARTGPTAPMRLATICLDDNAVRRRLEDRYDDLVQVLDRVEGRIEWSVKAFAPVAEREPASTAPTVGGAAYLQQKKAAADARQSHQADASEAAQLLHRELASISVASRLLAPQDPRLTGHPGTMVLNGAYLVDVQQSDAFGARVQALADDHPDLGIDGAGPWPPYSFAVLDTP